MRNKGYFISLTRKFLCISLLTCIFVLGIALQEGLCQYVNPYIPYSPFMPLAYTPVLPPPLPLFPVPYAPIPVSRAPQATIILSSGITAVSPTAGVVVIGAPTVVTPTTAPTIVSTVPTTTTTAAPAPLLSILVSLYATAIYSPTPLSVANPLLFAYISSLIL